MGWFSKGNSSTPTFKHGEALNRNILRTRGYPEFILDGVDNLNASNFFWLRNNGIHGHYEYETLAWGLYLPDTYGSEYVLYIHSDCAYLYQYKLDSQGDIPRLIKEAEGKYKQEVKTNSIKSKPGYIPDDTKRQAVVDAGLEYLDKKHAELMDLKSWEGTTDSSWYRRLRDEPIPLDDDNTLYDIQAIARSLLDYAYIDSGTTGWAVIMAGK